MNILQKVGNFGRAVKAMISYGRISLMGGGYNRLPSFSPCWNEYAAAKLITLYHSVAEVYIPIHLIAGGVAQGIYTLRDNTDNSVIENNKYMKNLFAQPNPLQNWSQFVYQKEVFEMLTGESFVYANVPDVYKVHSYRNVSTLINLPSDEVQIVTDLNVKILSATTITDIIKEYTVTNGNNGPVRISTDRVMFSKEASLKAVDMNIHGCSRLLSSKKNIDNLDAVMSARNVIFVNRGALVIISSAKADAAGGTPLRDKEKKALAEDFDSYGVTKGKKPFVITNVPITATNIGATIKDMEPFRETLANAEIIFGLYDVPTELMPRSEGATFENQAAAEKRLYNNVIIPRAKSLCQSLTNFLKLDEVGMHIDVSFDHIPVLQENLKEKSEVDWKNNETYRVAFLHGRVTLNDWRVAFKMQPVTKNKLYDKLVFDMEDSEIEQVEKIVKLSKGGGNNAAVNTQGNENTGNQ